MSMGFGYKYETHTQKTAISLKPRPGNKFHMLNALFC